MVRVRARPGRFLVALGCTPPLCVQHTSSLTGFDHDCTAIRQPTKAPCGLANRLAGRLASRLAERLGSLIALSATLMRRANFSSKSQAAIGRYWTW